MNIQLAREIYGQPWFVDSASLQGLTAALNHYKRGGAVLSQTKSNAFGSYDLKSGALLTGDARAADRSAGDQLISVIKLDGAITKGGGKSSYGTVDLAQELKDFDKMPNVIGHIVQIDSGGGSAVAVKYLRNAMLESSKPVVALFEDLGASAAYYIATGADYIYASTPETLVGSIGTMIEFQAVPKVSENKETGERSVRIYASQSTEKNGDFEEAINNLNFKPIQENRLNPLNDRFLADVLATRPKATADQLKGGIFEAKDVVGSLIDAIGGFEDAVNKVKDLSANSGTPNINLKEKGMTQSELLSQHPELCSTLITQGVEQERKRVRTILKFSHIDAKACATMVAEGSEPDSEFFADMQLKAISKAQLQDMDLESPEEIVTDPALEATTIVEDEKVLKQSAFVAAMRASAGLKKEDKQ